MSDNLRRFRAIRNALNKFFVDSDMGHFSRRLTTLAWLINGIVASRSPQLHRIASQTVDQNKTESRIDKCRRWLKNDHIDIQTFYLPFCKDLIACFAGRVLPIAIDGSVVGRGCMCLMFSLLYKNRALPLLWLVVKQNKGHLDESLHVQLLMKLRVIIPSDTQVILVGDGEFDGVEWQEAIRNNQWGYVLRTSKNSILIEDGEEFSFKQLGTYPGHEYLSIPQVHFTRKTFGPVHAVLLWKQKYKDPIYLISNLELAEEAAWWYKKRFHIETFFSDQKSRGFNLQKSHLSDPQRLMRLLICAALAYLWMIYLGELAMQKEWHHHFHRKNRCDLSLFQLGLRSIQYIVNQALAPPVEFKPIEIRQ